VAQVKDGIAFTEKILGKKFGDMEKPLLVAVRSGARDSMPGMMDTILNLGLNDQTVLALGKGQQQRTLRLGLLPPLHPDVWRRRHGRAKTAGEDHEPFEVVIHDLKHELFQSRGHRRHQTDRAGPCRNSSNVSKR
jgi:pyruvate,orthophosphate dikinase